MDKLITMHGVKERVGIGRSSIYKLMRAGGFPLPLKLGGKAVRWSLEEIDDWVSAQPRATGDHPR